MALSPRQPLSYRRRVQRIPGFQYHKDFMRLATLNVATIRGKEEELVELMRERKLMVLALAETRLKENGDKIIHENYRLIHSGTDSGRHGVAFLVAPDVAQYVEGFGERIISVDLKLSQGVSIVQVYAPQQGRPNEEKDEFYQLLHTVVDNVKHQDRLILCGDWNGHVEDRRNNYENIIGPHSIGNRNEEGQRIIRLCSGE